MSIKHLPSGLILKRLLTVTVALLSLTACGPSTNEVANHPESLETLKFRYLGSPGSVTLIELAESLGYLEPVKLDYVGISTGGPQGIQTVLTGDADISSPAFNGAVVKVVATGAPVTAVIASYGAVKDTLTGYYVLDDSPIRSARDLIGRKVAVNTLGAQMEFMLNEYLRRGGLTEAEIKQVTLVVVPPGSGEQTLRQHQVDVASLTGQATERGGIRQLFREYDLFGEFTAGAYVMSTRFLKEKPNTSRKVVGGIARAIEWSRSTPRDEIIARFEKILAERKRNENSDALKYWTGWGIAGPGGTFADTDFSVWAEQLVREGQIKAQDVRLPDIYTNAFNPYVAATPNN
jgi:ABC-type nitrate/sulfonate/bicarbonate transport system substrate-binding protein